MRRLKNSVSKISFKSNFKTKIIFLVIFAWLVPIILILFFSYNIFQKDIKSSINENFKNKIDYSFNIPKERIDRAINLSRKTSTDKYVEVAYKNFLNENISEEILYKEITNYILRTYYSQKEIQMTCIELNGVDKFFYNDSGEYLSFLKYQNKIRQNIMKDINKIDTYIGFYIDDYSDIYLYRNLFITNNSKREKIGSIVFRLNPEYLFFETLRNFSNTSANILCTLNGEVLHILTSDENIQKNNINYLNSKKFILDNNNTYYGNRIKSSDYILQYSVGLNNSELYEELNKFQMSTITIIILIIPLIFLLANLLYKNTNAPLTQLSEAINEIQLGKLGLQLDALNNNEYDYLFNAFNSMSNQLYILFEKVYKQEVATKDAKIMSLRAQINPHFLNNTLEIMNWQARLGDTESVIKMIESLSVMLDATMNRENEIMAPLYKELKYCDAYLYIISERYKDRVQIIKDIDNNLLNYQVPSLIIQPLIENAVKHGLEPVGRGYIKINIKEENNYIIIEVSNDGKPLSESDKKKIDRLLNYDDPNYSLGIRNVNKRLNLIFDSESCMKIYSKNQITTAKIIIPFS